MTVIGHTPSVYLLKGCPFCMKLLIFLLEAGLIDRVKLVEASTPEEQNRIADLLKNTTGKSSFPTAEIAPYQYLSDSDALVAHFAAAAGVDPETLIVYQNYLNGVFMTVTRLFRENIELKKRLG
ncbi:glutathione S-transferase N-terminal domain-containing protein [Mesorhizobium calcicola]|uniref:Glutathione S-transferase N-terminal domain-containing protein n=1 Tax=Mesorhizobium calcicola TaxID=1300310 RepID=A0ABW4WGZ5_9HYPH